MLCRSLSKFTNLSLLCLLERLLIKDAEENKILCPPLVVFCLQLYLQRTPSGPRKSVLSIEVEVVFKGNSIMSAIKRFYCSELWRISPLSSPRRTPLKFSNGLLRKKCFGTKGTNNSSSQLDQKRIPYLTNNSSNLSSVFWSTLNSYSINNKIRCTGVWRSSSVLTCSWNLNEIFKDRAENCQLFGLCPSKRFYWLILTMHACRCVGGYCWWWALVHVYMCGMLMLCRIL